ncbi:putative NOP5 family protein [uncultured archaeon]|nr:putative NOP5 family protein [uncultured archaeon]
MVLVTVNALGAFAIKKGRVIEQRLFPTDEARVVGDEITPEEDELIQLLIKTGNKEIETSDPRRYRSKGYDATFKSSNEFLDAYEVANKVGIPPQEVEKRIQAVNTALTRMRLTQVGRDQLVIQAVAAIDDIDEVGNRLVERLREWYSLHFPELNYLATKHSVYARIVRDTGLREDYVKEKLPYDAEFVSDIIKASKDSVGGTFTKQDAEAAQKLTEPLLAVWKTRDDIEKYLTELMQEVAPNLSAVVGPIIAARLIQIAGGLENLSRMPASTIQILGAEDAFFRFLKTGQRPPKHGIIFAHPDIRSKPKVARGRLARTLAAKATTAAKTDYFKGGFIGDRLTDEFKKRVKSLS